MLVNSQEKRPGRLIREGLFREVLCKEGPEDSMRKCRNEAYQLEGMTEVGLEDERELGVSQDLKGRWYGWQSRSSGERARDEPDLNSSVVGGHQKVPAGTFVLKVYF